VDCFQPGRSDPNVGCGTCELRKLCNEEGIVVEAGLSAAALLEKLDEHYKGDDSDDK